MEGGRWIPAGCFGGLGSLKVLDLGFFVLFEGFFVCGTEKTTFFQADVTLFFIFFPLYFSPKATKKYFVYSTELAQVSCANWFPGC